jgi:hypothetical protein
VHVSGTGNATVGFVAPSRVDCTASFTAASYSAPLYFTCTVAPASSFAGLLVPTGDLLVGEWVGGVFNVLQSVTLQPSGSPATASALWVTTALQPGVHMLGAQYAGNSAYDVSAAAAVTVSITRVDTSLTVAPLPTESTVLAGGSVSLLVVTLAPTATGNVTFYVDGVAVGARAAVGGSAALPYVFRAGYHTIEAAFAGDDHFTPANVSLPSVSVARGTPDVRAIATPAAALATDAVTLLCIVPAGATGSVSFSVDGVAVGQAPVADTGIALLTVRGGVLPVGPHAVLAVYSGDVSFSSAPAPAASFTVAAAPQSPFLYVAIGLGALLFLVLAAGVAVCVYRSRRAPVLSGSASYPTIASERDEYSGAVATQPVMPQPETPQEAAVTVDVQDDSIRARGPRPTEVVPVVEPRRGSSGRKRSSQKGRAPIASRQREDYGELDDDAAL